MSNLYQIKMQINRLAFENHMTEDDWKNHIKKQLAFEIANQMIETGKISFTYKQEPDLLDNITVIARVQL